MSTCCLESDAFFLFLVVGTKRLACSLLVRGKSLRNWFSWEAAQALVRQGAGLLSLASAWPVLPSPWARPAETGPKAAPRPWIKTQATHSTFLAASTHLSCRPVSKPLERFQLLSQACGHSDIWFLLEHNRSVCSPASFFPSWTRSGGKGSQNLMLLIWRFPILFRWLHALAWPSLDLPKTTPFPVCFQHSAKKNVQYEKNVCYPQMQRPFGKKYLEGF